MSVLAMSKQKAYIIKQTDAQKIINSKNSLNDMSAIKKRARQFASNNLKKNF